MGLRDTLSAIFGNRDSQKIKNDITSGFGRGAQFISGAFSGLKKGLGHVATFGAGAAVGGARTATSGMQGPGTPSILVIILMVFLSAILWARDFNTGFNGLDIISLVENFSTFWAFTWRSIVSAAITIGIGYYLLARNRSRSDIAAFTMLGFMTSIILLFGGTETVIHIVVGFIIVYTMSDNSITARQKATTLMLLYFIDFFGYGLLTYYLNNPMVANRLIFPIWFLYALLKSYEYTTGFFKGISTFLMFMVLFLYAFQFIDAAFIWNQTSRLGREDYVTFYDFMANSASNMAFFFNNMIKDFKTLTDPNTWIPSNEIPEGPRFDLRVRPITRQREFTEPDDVVFKFELALPPEFTDEIEFEASCLAQPAGEEDPWWYTPDEAHTVPGTIGTSKDTTMDIKLPFNRIIRCDFDLSGETILGTGGYGEWDIYLVLRTKQKFSARREVYLMCPGQYYEALEGLPDRWKAAEEEAEEGEQIRKNRNRWILQNLDVEYDSLTYVSNDLMTASMTIDDDILVLPCEEEETGTFDYTMLFELDHRWANAEITEYEELVLELPAHLTLYNDGGRTCFPRYNIVKHCDPLQPINSPNEICVPGKNVYRIQPEDPQRKGDFYLDCSLEYDGQPLGTDVIESSIEITTQYEATLRPHQTITVINPEAQDEDEAAGYETTI